MNFNQFQSRIGRGKLVPVYALVGPEEFFAREAIRLLREATLRGADPSLCFIQTDGEQAQPADVFDELRTRTFFGTGKLVVIHNASAFLARHAAALINYLKRPSSTGVLVLVTDKLDGRTAVAKALADGVVECKRPFERHLPGWLRQRARHHRITLSPDSAALLVQLIGRDLMQLDLQLEKLATFAGKDGRVTLEHVAQAVGYDKLVDVFELTDAVAEGRPGAGLETLHRLLDHGERPEYVLGMLAWQFRWLRRTRHLLDQGLAGQALAKQLGKKAFFVDKLARQARRFSTDALIDKQRRLHQADVALKTRAEGDGGLRLAEQLVVHLCC